MYRLAFSLLTLLATSIAWAAPATTAPATPPASCQPNAPGCFDYYVFAELWLPAYCVTNFTANCQGLDTTFTNRFSTHGLWQDYLPREGFPPFPNFCSKEKFDPRQLSGRRLLQLATLYVGPLEGLKEHEWEKHGTCDGTPQDIYFAKIAALTDRTQGLEKRLPQWLAKGVAYDTFVNAIGHGGGMTIGCIQVNDRQYVSQILRRFDKHLKPQKGEIDSPVERCDPKRPLHFLQPIPILDAASWQQRIQNQYGGKTIAVGFDIDDTLLFSSPGFAYMQSFNSTITPDNPAYWERINGDLSYYSMLKENVAAILQFHLQRGDSVYAITARPSSKDEKQTAVLQTLLKTDKIGKVIFTNNEDKTSAMKEHKIAIYYGDADADMTSAKKAGAQGIRVLRSPASNNHNPVLLNAIEDVLLLGTEQ